MRLNVIPSSVDCSGVRTAGPGVDDRLWIASPFGWVLRYANGVNNQKLIIGNGTLNGTARGYVLVPRVPGN
jgi:hypothetical protein